MPEVAYFDNPRAELLVFLPSKFRKVFEIGCGAGGFAAEIRKRHECAYEGLELNPQAAAAAENLLDRVTVGSVEENLQSLSFKGVDLLVCNDVFEHLASPWKVLERLREEIDAPCHVLFSIPNVRYIETVVELVIKGDWCYRDWGVLDRTHLRFFTKKSFDRSFGEWGGEIVESRFINPCKSKTFRFLSRMSLGLLREFEHEQYAGLAIVQPG